MTKFKKFLSIDSLTGIEEKPKVPPITNDQIVGAQDNDKKVQEAYALVQAIENEKIARQNQCWKEISKVAAKYGFQISASHQPVNITVELLPL